MSALTITMSILLWVMIGYGQTAIGEVRSTVPTAEILKNWKAGETKTFEDGAITKVTQDFNNRYRTNIYYNANAAETKQVDGVVAVGNTIDNTSGTLHLFVDRSTPEAVDLRNFSVELRDKLTNEVLYRVHLNHQAARHFKHDVYYNYTAIDLPRRIGKNFQVMIYDHYKEEAIGYYELRGGDDYRGVHIATR